MWENMNRGKVFLGSEDLVMLMNIVSCILGIRVMQNLIFTIPNGIVFTGFTFGLLLSARLLVHLYQKPLELHWIIEVTVIKI